MSKTRSRKSTMDDDYINHDDLINDYINNNNDDDEPYDDDFEDQFIADDTGNENHHYIGGAPPSKVAGGEGINISSTSSSNREGRTPFDGARISVGALAAEVTKDEVVNKNYDTRIMMEPQSWEKIATALESPNHTLYQFERYNGLSSWRSTKTNIEGGGVEKSGATTMEATSWKKKTGTTKAGVRKRNVDDEEEEESEDEDNMDSVRLHPNNSTGSITSHGMSNRVRAGDVQLVQFREKEDLVVLGQAWGNNKRGEEREVRSYYSAAPANNMPILGERSMPITLADGTVTFVKRSSFSGGGDDGSSKDDNEKKEEGCLLGLPMSELVRRADILQRRAISRKVEREARHGGRKDAVDSSSSAGITLEDVSGDTHVKNDYEQDDKVETTQTNNDKNEEKKERRRITRALEYNRHEHKMMQLQQRLWVDKHAPTSISHLLSDEKTNREVLRALRGWDPYVFKKEAPSRPAPIDYGSRYGGEQSGGNDWKKNKGIDNARRGGGKWQQHKKAKVGGDNDDAADENNQQRRVDVRPDETSRVILLSGPPGVGKTTLAHIVCNHAGYRAVEVNASDERTGSALTERVLRAMEGTTLDLVGNAEKNDMKDEEDGGERRKLRRGGKPNCIILDEIDGADAKSIAVLVDIIRAEIPPMGGKKGKKGVAPYLRRPIILICNHKYAPALRPILPYARQFDVQPPNPERLTGRLRAVLASERMSVVAGGMLLRRLVAGTGGDVRSCLYALQFASARARELAVKKRERESGGMSSSNKGDALMVDISSTLMAALGENGNGLKDMQGDISSTVATVFRKAKSMKDMIGNKRQKTSNGSSNMVSSSPKGVDVVLKVVDHFGDNSKTLDCLWMNVNRVSYVDPTLDRCCTALEWLSSADTYRSHKSNVAMNNSAEHQSMQKYYIPTAAAAIHLLCCVETRPDLTFSTRPLSDCHYQNEANVSLVHRFVEGLPSKSRRGVGGGTDTVVSDVIPYGLWLLSAGDGKHALSKPVSSVDILSLEEKLAFSAHVQTLRDLGLTYVKDGGTFDYNHTKNFRLEPEIDKLVRFEFLGDSVGRREIPALLKELLAHGVTVAALRERESEALLSQQAAAAREMGKPSKPKDGVIIYKADEKPPAVTPKKGPDDPVSNTSAAKNFLGFRAAKAKEAKSARRAATVGFDRSKTMKLSNTGSGVEISKVIRFKYQKGFTQAVRAPCQMDDLL